MSDFNLNVLGEKQPRGKLGGPNTPKYVAGSARSIGRLKYLQFDPINELVSKYRQLDGELERQLALRSGALVELNANGRPRNFNPEVLMSIYDKQIAIAEKLLRYKYGRVPEVELPNQERPTALVVNLTKKGETYVVNNEPASEEFVEPDEE